jgi:hypothetical protein
MPSTAAERIVLDLFCADSGEGERVGLTNACAEPASHAPAPHGVQRALLRLDSKVA